VWMARGLEKLLGYSHTGVKPQTMNNGLSEYFSDMFCWWTPISAIYGNGSIHQLCQQAPKQTTWLTQTHSDLR
jgi:hypothetical protein